MSNKSTNSPSSDSERGQKSEAPKMNLLELLGEVSSELVFSELHNEADLLARLRNNPQELIGNIRAEMKRRLLASPSDYTDIPLADITIAGPKLEDATILEKLDSLLIGLKTDQEKLQKKVVSLFSESTFGDTPAGRRNDQDLKDWCQKQNEKNIEKYLKYPLQLRKQLQRDDCFGDRVKYFVSRDTLSFLDRVGLNEDSLSLDEKEACAQILRGTGTLTDRHIRIYLNLIDKSQKPDVEKLAIKREIIKEFLPTVTPKFLVELGVITERSAREKVKIGMESLLGADYFTTGTDKEQLEKRAMLKEAYEKGQYIRIDVDTYLHNPTFLKAIFEKDKKIDQNPLIQSIYDTIHDMQTELHNAQFDMDGLKITRDAQGNWHNSFVDNIAGLKIENNAQKVRNARSLNEGSFIRMVVDVNGEKKYGYFKIIDTDVEGTMPSGMRDEDGLPVKHRGVRLENWGDGDGMVLPGRQTGPFYMDYVKLWTQLSGPADSVEILNSQDILERRSSAYEGEDKIKTTYSEEDGYDSIDTLSDALGWKPEPGMVYTTQDVEGGADFFVEVLSIDEHSGNIIISDGGESHPISFSEFYKLAKDLKLKSVATRDTDSNIEELIHSIEGFKDIIIEDGVIKQKLKDKDGKDVSVPIHHFINADGEGVYFTSIGSMGAEAAFGKAKGAKSKKHKDGQDWEEVAGKVNIGAFKSSKNNFSLTKILNILKENGHKPYINPKDAPVIDMEDHMPHTHGSLWGKIMNGTSVSDMMKAFDLYKHAWEHKLEKNSKFQAAKFADTYLKHLMPEGFAYQLRSEAYSAQNEAMEGILKMLENDMSGKEARLYIRKKILLNDDAKFEEVLAGLLYISKKTGQLYPEELSDLKNSQIWFYKLAVTQGYTSKAARAELRAKCIDKTDKAADGTDAVSEMDIIERQLKLYEGQGKRIPPNIAPKFPGALVEGKKGNFEKGELEINQRTNIKQMNKYALSKLNVGEAYKVMGTIDRIHGKNGNAVELNVIPFTLLMSNMPEYMGSEFRKELHSRGTGLYASHAFKFGNELPLVNTYRDAVGLAAEEVARRTGNHTILDKLHEIEHERHHIGNESHNADHETEKEQKDWINSIYEFWMEYGKELQPILQMSDTHLSMLAETNSTAKKYKERYEALSGMQNGQYAKIYDCPNVVEGNMIPDHTPFHFTNLVHATVHDINAHTGQLRNPDASYGKIFRPGVLGALHKLKYKKVTEVPPGYTLRDVQYKQFEEYYAALVYYFRKVGGNTAELMFGGSRSGKQFPSAKYIADLHNYGLDFSIKDFTRTSSTTPAGVEITQESDYAITYLDEDDKKRCKQMFESFMNSSANVGASTRSKIGNTIDWESMGG